MTKSTSQSTQLEAALVGLNQSQITRQLSGGFGNSNLINHSEDPPFTELSEDLYVKQVASDRFNLRPTKPLRNEQPKGPLKERIIRTALEVPPKERRQQMRDYFDKQGRLYKAYENYNIEIRKAREKRKPTNQQQSLEKQRVPIIPKSPDQQLGDGIKRVVDNPTTLPIVPIGRRRIHTEAERATWKQPPNKKGKSEIFPSNVSAGTNGAFFVYRGEVPSLQTGRKLHKANINTPSTINTENKGPNQSHMSSAGESHSQYALRIQPVSRVFKPNSSCTAIDMHAAAQPSERFSVPEAALDPVYQPSQLPSPTTDCTKAHEVANPLLSDDHATLSSQPQSAVTICTEAQERDRQGAVSPTHKTLQRQIARVIHDCDICDESPCSCDKSQQSAEDIMCNGELCFKKWFSNDFLENHMSIQLGDALDYRRDYGVWLCPICAFKKAKLDSRGPNVLPAPSALPQFGSNLLADDEIRNYLGEFWGLTSSYIRLAKKASMPPNMRMQPLLQLPCVREEVSDERYSPLIYVLGRILKVDPGRSVKDVVIDLQLQDLEPSLWTRAVLVFLFFEFIFKTASPFDEVAIWRQGLIHSFEPDLADMWVQDNRIRTMRENTGDYHRCHRVQRDMYIRRLNAAMMPLIGGMGGNEAINRIHMRIADIAGDLNAKFAAYTGTFEGIMPGIGDRFDARIHVSDDPLDEYKDLSGRLIMLTTMVGIKFHIPGKEWRYTSKAKVWLWPASDQLSTSSDTSLPSGSGTSCDRRDGSRKRPHHDMT